MAYRRDNIAGFEAVLRRTLRERAQHSPCSGFDPDLASAYLERSLTDSSMALFEGHLSGCSSCRTAVTTLQRLAPEPQVPAIGAEIAAPAWYDRLRAFAARWTIPRPAIWAGGAAAVATLVIGIGLSLSSHFATSRSQVPGLVASASPDASARRADSMAALESKQAPADALTANGAIASSSPTPESAVVSQSARAKEVPKPSLGPVVAATSNGAIFGTVSDPQGSAVARAMVTLADVNAKQNRVTITDENGRFRFDGLGGGDYVVTAEGKVFNHVRLPSATIDPQTNPGAEVTFKLEPKTSSTGAAVASAGSGGRVQGASRTRGQAVESETTSSSADNQRSPAVVLIDKTQEDVAMAAVPPLLRSRLMSHDASSSTKAPRMKAHEVESIQSLTRRVRDKTFRFTRGVWIDASYDPDDKLPVVELTSASSEFETLLTREPGLKPFFDLGPVTLVWHGIVYHVKKAE